MCVFDWLGPKCAVCQFEPHQEELAYLFVDLEVECQAKLSAAVYGTIRSERVIAWAVGS